MREIFHDELAQLGDTLCAMCTHAARAMRDATTALRTTDLALAEQVLARDAELDDQRARCEAQAQMLLALQAPVASELRFVLAAVYCADKIERMGDLAVHIADVTRFHHPRPAAQDALMDKFGRLGKLTSSMADRLAGLLAAPVEGMHAELQDADYAVDDLHAEILELITTPSWDDGPAAASNAALLSRFYERYGDQIVSAAKRVEFTVTGSLPA